MSHQDGITTILVTFYAHSIKQEEKQENYFFHLDLKSLFNISTNQKQHSLITQSFRGNGLNH